MGIERKCSFSEIVELKWSSFGPKIDSFWQQVLFFMKKWQLFMKIEKQLFFSRKCKTLFSRENAKKRYFSEKLKKMTTSRAC